MKKITKSIIKAAVLVTAINFSMIGTASAGGNPFSGVIDAINHNTHYNSHGYDSHGYNRHGYNRHGYNRHGYNRHGYNSHGRYNSHYNRH